MLRAIFGRSDEKKADRAVKEINKLEPKLEAFSDFELKEKSLELKKQTEEGKSLDDLLPEAFALVREAAKRTLKQRHFDTQLTAGYYIHQGTIVEMMTGEGKTLSSTCPVYLNALSGEGVHMITVNDYLARRDCVWMGQIYHALGLSVSCLVHEGAFIYDPDFSGTEEEKKETDEKRDIVGAFKVEQKYLRPVSRKQGYAADITYGTNTEFGFDYLRDNLAPTPAMQSQRKHNFAVIDEVDSILIDEARTPLIISAPDQSSSDYYKIMARAVLRLEKDRDYTVDEKLKSVSITEEGIDNVEKTVGVADLYSTENLRLAHYLEESLKAKALFTKDRDYVVKDGEIVIVDQFTGRLMHGRRYSGGLHQAIEAKEGVQVKEESKTFAQVTIQNYFRLYKKISGMTGTAQTSAEEFHKVYNLEVMTVPTNRPVVRKDMTDVIYKTADAKYKAVAEDIKRRQELGQPVLIGTVSIEKNEIMAGYLVRAGVRFEILNAKNHEREGAIIAQAGRKGAVTLATNMAGRGVDIILGGNPPVKEETEEVHRLGGLHVVGTERHEARRIDNQLRGRSGRQGDPGSSQFFLSLEDDLMRIFGGSRLKSIMERLNIPEDQPIESGMISKSLIEAQKKVEGMNFDARKHLLEYDDVLNKQRLAVYRKRQELIEAGDEEFRMTLSEIAEKLGENGKALSEFAKKEGDLLPHRRAAVYILDMLWMNHLEDLEALAEFVRIRAYGQHDPLVEYRRESHALYHRMFDSFESWLAENLPKIEVTEEMVSEMADSDGEPLKPLDLAPEELAKIGRNDPCPCGSGKKFKRCHGK